MAKRKRKGGLKGYRTGCLVAAFFNFLIENPPSLLIQLSLGGKWHGNEDFLFFGRGCALQSSLMVCHLGLTDLACVSMGKCVGLQLSVF